MKKRDSAYYRRRLAKDHPAIFTEVVAGRLSVRAASAKAGLIHLPTRLDALKREWKKAPRIHQSQFAKWVNARAAAARPPIADLDGRLRPEVAKFMSDWIEAYQTTPGRILGIAPANVEIGGAALLALSR